MLMLANGKVLAKASYQVRHIVRALEDFLEYKQIKDFGA